MRRAAAAGGLLRRRTTRPRCRRRCASSPPCACSPTRRPATASPASRSTAPIPTTIAAAFAWAAERARAGAGPDADRARVDAHVRPRASRRHAVSRQGSAAVVGLPAAAPSSGYADRELYEFWAARDPIPRVRRAARGRGGHRRAASSTRLKREAEALVEAQAQRGDRRRRGRTPDDAGAGVFAGRAAARARRGARPGGRGSRRSPTPALPPLEPAPPFDQEGQHVPRRR